MNDPSVYYCLFGWFPFLSYRDITNLENVIRKRFLEVKRVSQPPSYLKGALQVWTAQTLRAEYSMSLRSLIESRRKNTFYEDIFQSIFNEFEEEITFAVYEKFLVIFKKYSSPENISSELAIKNYIENEFIEFLFSQYEFITSSFSIKVPNQLLRT
jgi:hypothetical protein